MSILDNLKKRLDINNDSDDYHIFDKTRTPGLSNMQARLNVRGGTDQWTRMREDKLWSLKKALLSSYQSAVVQKYDVKKDSLANNIIVIITLLQDQQELSQNQLNILKQLEEEYVFISDDKYSVSYINTLMDIVNALTTQEPYFRCLINHDKLKVDYEDKIISIPFFEPPIGKIDPIETDFHNGTVFKWVHGNKEEWTPDTYWIVYMQYSEETAYFRAEIRKADEEIQIVTIDDEGNENTVTYRGWMTGPNETTALWNIKKDVTWNDMNYTKLLYITKDEDTVAFFNRFDRIIINGKPWEVQAYNERYSTSKTKGTDTGIIRVALKETYTSTDQFIRETNEAAAAKEEAQAEYDETHTQARVDGVTVARPYDTLVYKVKNVEDEQEIQQWSISDPTLARIVKISEDGHTAKIQILSLTGNQNGFNISYGSLSKHVIIKSL